jgi:hypothetical protein
MTYRLWIKGKEGLVSPAPDETWDTLAGAELAIVNIEFTCPELKGQIVVKGESDAG